MLTKERIGEAEKNVQRYLNEGLLKKIGKIDENIINLLKNNCNESIRTADFLFQNNNSWLWVIVSSYYSMFYIANAVLYKLGYKVGDKIAHKVTLDSLIALIRNKLKSKLIEDFDIAKDEALELAGIKADNLMENFEFELTKRSRFQYEMTEIVKMSKAETSLKRAKEFIFELEKLLLSLK